MSKKPLLAIALAAFGALTFPLSVRPQGLITQTEQIADSLAKSLPRVEATLASCRQPPAFVQIGMSAIASARSHIATVHASLAKIRAGSVEEVGAMSGLMAALSKDAENLANSIRLCD